MRDAGMKNAGEERAIAGINNFIPGARHYSSQKESGGFLFLHDLDRKDDSCAITHDFLRVPPFSSILSRVPFPPLILSSLIPVGGLLRRSRFSPSFFFFFFFFLPDEFNSCRRSADALSIFPDFRRHRVAFAYRFRCADTHESIRSPPFNITRSPRRFCPSRPDASLHVIRTADEERVAVSISSARPYVLRPEAENYRRGTRRQWRWSKQV